MTEDVAFNLHFDRYLIMTIRLITLQSSIINSRNIMFVTDDRQTVQMVDGQFGGGGEAETIGEEDSGSWVLESGVENVHKGAQSAEKVTEGAE